MSDEDVEDLQARRLTDQVLGRVEQAIRQRYFWVNLAGALTFAIVTWLGGSALLSTFVKDRVDEEVTKKSAQIDAAVLESAVQTGVAREKLGQLQETLEQGRAEGEELRSALKELDDRAKNLQNLIDSSVSASNAIKTNTADIAVLKTAVNDLGRLSNEVSRLRELTLSIAERAPGMAEQAQDLRSAAPAANVAQSVATAQNELAERTVYLQFSGPVTRSAIQRVSEELKLVGYNIPGEERVASTRSEVRWFHTEDRDFAKDLAGKATSILRDQGFGSSITVETTDYTDYAKAKPRIGVVELWLANLSEPHAATPATTNQ